MRYTALRMDPRAQREGPVYENPSADKFGPPPPSPHLRSPSKLVRGLTRMAVVCALYVAADWLRSASKDRTWWTVFSGVVVVVSVAFDYVIQRHAGGEDEDEHADPYSPPTHLTR